MSDFYIEEIIYHVKGIMHTLVFCKISELINIIMNITRCSREVNSDSMLENVPLTCFCYYNHT